MKSLGTVLLVFVFAQVGCNYAQRAQDGPGDPTLFAGMKGLAGKWEASDEDKDGKPDVTLVYRVTSGGSAIEETIFPGTPEEMVTLYNQDRGRLTLTHYCMMGNQPRLQATSESTPTKVVFKLTDGMNMDPAKDHYMGAMILTVVDADHIQQEWTSFKEGKAEEPHVFKLTRVKG